MSSNDPIKLKGAAKTRFLAAQQATVSLVPDRPPGGVHGHQWQRRGMRSAPRALVATIEGRINSLQEDNRILRKTKKVLGQKLDALTSEKALIDTLTEKNEDLEAQVEKWRGMHGDAQIELQAEDSTWRKRFRALKKAHNTLKKAVKDREVRQDPLDVLADSAAVLEDWAQEAAQAEKQEVFAAVQDRHQAQQLRQESEARLKEASDKLRDLHAREAELVARQSDLVAKEAELASIAKVLNQKSAAIDARVSEADAYVANAQRMAANRSAAPPKSSKATRAPRKGATNATTGSEAHSRWVRRQRGRIVEAFQGIFGRQWHEQFRGSKENLPDSPCDDSSTSPDDVVEVLKAFFNSYQGLFDAVGDTDTGRVDWNIATKAEGQAAEAIQRHLDKCRCCFTCIM